MFEFKLENSLNEVVNLNDNNNYIVVGATGLTPPRATIYTSSSANKKGSKYNGSTIEERSLNLTIKLLGDIEANRNNLYKWIDSEQYVKVYYRNGVKNVYCEGYVEIPNLELFTENEIVELEILCPNPYWKDLQDVVVDISVLLKQFTFPFSIVNPIPFSTIKDDGVTKVFNSGNETGMIIRAVFKRAITNFIFEDAIDSTKKIGFKSTFTFNKDDTLIINTEDSPKTIKRISSDGAVENILKYVDGKPYWFQLKKGYNSFTYTSSNNSGVEVTISFTNKYLGV